MQADNCGLRIAQIITRCTNCACQGYVLACPVDRHDSQATLEPAGLTPLLLNKFLAVGRRRSAEGKLAQHPNNDV